MRNTKWRQGIDDSVCYCWTRADSPSFTTAFGAERIDRGGSAGTGGSWGGPQGGLGHGLIQGPPRGPLPFLIVDALCGGGPPPPLPPPPVPRPTNKGGINNFPQIAHRHK